MKILFPMVKQLLKHIWRHKEVVLIVILATWLRVWQLDTHLILFGDAAFDIQNAITAVKQHQLPLLGIASSVPRFKQGPLTVWLEMIIYLIAGQNLLVFGVIFASLGILAVIGVYELFASEGRERLGLLSSFLFAFSPLAVAHSRMPYHIVPIPLCLVIYFWSLRRLQQKVADPRRVFVAVFCFCLLFQFELAMAPLFLLIPYIFWRNRQRINPKLIGAGLLSLTIGLLPQIIFDLTHHFAQLGGFLVWVVYRVVALGAVKHAHGLSFSHVQQAFTAFELYFGKIWSVNLPWLAVVMTGVALWGFVWLGKLLRQSKLKTGVLEIVFIATALLAVGYFIHGSPSEAYFPPWEVLLPVLAAFCLERLLLSKHVVSRVFVFLVLGAYAVINLGGIVKANFFVSTPDTFSYGPSLAEQYQMVDILRSFCQPSCHLLTTREDGKFENFFANYRLLAPALQLNDVQSSHKIYLETKDSPLRNTLNMMAYDFDVTTVFVPIGTGLTK
jgi:4-amino-4-deoxy-L-arabinose transferase-like glycosyltransferase